MDLHAFSIWNDYITFLKSVDATGSYAENQKITAVRKVYQKAVVTPIIGIEVLWKEYILFEQNINPIISEKMSLERSRDYMNARRVAKELEIVTKGLNRNLPAIPPTLTKEEMKQVIACVRIVLVPSTNFGSSNKFAGGTVEKVHRLREIESAAQRRHRTGDASCYVRNGTMFARVDTSSGCVASGCPIFGPKFETADGKRRAYFTFISYPLH